MSNRRKNIKKYITSKGEVMVDIFVCPGEIGNNVCPIRDKCLRHQLYDPEYKKQIDYSWQPRKKNCPMYLDPDTYND